MKLYLLLILILLAPGAFGQDGPIRIGEIEFYGATGINLDKVRAALPFHEGDTITEEMWPRTSEQAQQAIKQVIGHAPTEITRTCCDDRANLIIFIGLSGTPLRYLPAPKGSARLPSNAINLYDQWWNNLVEGVRKGAGAEDESQGYALSTAYPPLRAIQLRMRAYALRHDRLLRDVLVASADDHQRAMAAELLGYARQSRSQITALVQAARDPNRDVRNNATRALIVLAASNSKLARQIPAGVFIEMLLSGTWTDVNKASALLSNLTAGRNPALLAQLRRPSVLERLVEMARWRTTHANAARIILGRMAGIEETRLQQLADAGKVEEIIAALHSTQ